MRWRPIYADLLSLLFLAMVGWAVLVGSGLAVYSMGYGD